MDQLDGDEFGVALGKGLEWLYCAWCCSVLCVSFQFYGNVSILLLFDFEGKVKSTLIDLHAAYCTVLYGVAPRTQHQWQIFVPQFGFMPKTKAIRDSVRANKVNKTS